MAQTSVMITPDGTSMELAETDDRPAIKVANALAGKSEQVRGVVRAVTHLAHSPDLSALIRGEVGVGKEVVTRCIHRADTRPDIKLVKLDAATLDMNGRITFAWLDGAEKAFKDCGGTLLIEHVDKLSPSVQAAVVALVTRLRMETSPEHIVRLLSITTEDIEQAVAEGRFRKDLFYRLGMVTLTIPPLRERVEDIPVLANQFLAQMNQHLGKQIERLSEGAIKRMLAYPWPGNIRELRSVIERAAILTLGRSVPPEHVMVSGPNDDIIGQGDDVTLAEMERRLILRMLKRTGGNRSRTAKLLGINRGTLYNKLRQYRISSKRLNAANDSPEETVNGTY